MFTQVGVKQLTDFLRTVTAASDLVDCTLVNCVKANSEIHVFTLLKANSETSKQLNITLDENSNTSVQNMKKP